MYMFEPLAFAWPACSFYYKEALRTICKLPYDKGKCNGYYTRYYFNLETKECEKFVYGGCYGNGNRFRTISDCKQMCTLSTEHMPLICKLPPKKGMCHAIHTRYYYNMVHNECEKFVYGGCMGNGNRFYTVEECNKRCTHAGEQP
ncbi:BPTI/Kunitz domain-containing protein-like isoform X2 [Rhineura floridana]|uniref:BPTI/Kunitz domain-containing protein-like isoform X2 n=1 Tax=Rhineura floridana TaxID=261503 RepID=UPI002AC863E5|nr:BPTI/Kunitz domain-containing protein-like isoform X2 [Rhineura floridana]